MNPKRGEAITLLLVLVAALGILLPNLGNTYLWQDEAQTALISRTVLTHGLPMGTDGRNWFSQDLGAEYTADHVWRWHNWFPFYLLAAFFAVLGEGTFVARLPFALCGAGTVALTWFVARRLWSDWRAGLAAGAVLTLSVPFALLVRQSRYYAPAMLFAMLTLWAYLRLTDGRRHGWVWFALAGALLFHTHYLHCGILLLAVLLHAALWHRDRIRPLLLGCAGVLLLSAPWYVWMSGMGHFDVYGASVRNWSKIAGYLWKYLSLLGRHIFDPWLLLVPAAVLVAAAARRQAARLRSANLWNPLSLPLLVLVITLAVMSVATPAAWFRNLAPLLPVCALLIGRIVIVPLRQHVLLSLAIVAFLVIRSPLPDYLGELTRDFDGPVEAIVGRLEAQGSPQQSVAITYGDLPLKFYTGMRVYGGLTGEDLANAATADWVILRAHAISRKDMRFRQFLMQRVDWNRYRRITLDRVDTRFENREEPDTHRFRTAADGPPVTIFRRVDYN